MCGSVCREEERLTVAAWSVERGAWSMEHGASPSAGHHHHLPHAKEAGVSSSTGRQDWQKKDSATGSCIQGKQGSFRMF